MSKDNKYSINTTSNDSQKSDRQAKKDPSTTATHKVFQEPVQGKRTWLSETIRLIMKPKIKLSDQQLSPSELSHKLFDELKPLGFINLEKKPRPYEMQKFLLYKEGIDSVMFVPQACNDVKNRDSNKFILSGGYGISDALADIVKSPQYIEAKENNKKIEIHIPLALTRRGALGIARAHWVTAIINEENNRMTLDILDSMESSFGYNFSHVAEEISTFVTKANETTFSSRGEEMKAADSADEDYVMLKTPDFSFDGNIKNKYTGEQGLSDHNSCGFFVIKYIKEYAQNHYPTISVTKEIPAYLSAEVILTMSPTRNIISTNDEGHGPNSIQKPSNNQDGRRIT